MRLVVQDETDNIMVEYDHGHVRELLIKYYEVLGDVGKAYDQLSADLLQRARTQ